MKQWKRTAVALFVFCLLSLCLCACGSTVTTEQANEYLDEEGTATNGAASGECTLVIECKTILDNKEKLDAAKEALVPEDGVVLAETTVAFDEGESVLDVLKRVTKEHKIQMEFEKSPAYDGGYVNGIANLYEFDCGSTSGWEYYVNDWSPNYGCGNYILTDGDHIAWRYTCDNGKDLQ